MLLPLKLIHLISNYHLNHRESDVKILFTSLKCFLFSCACIEAKSDISYLCSLSIYNSSGVISLKYFAGAPAHISPLPTFSLSLTTEPAATTPLTVVPFPTHEPMATNASGPNMHLPRVELGPMNTLLAIVAPLT